MENAKKELSLEELIDFKNWSKFEDFIEKFDPELEKVIKKDIQCRKELRQKLLADTKFKEKIRTVNKNDIEWAKEELFGNNVCAVDGTVTSYHTPSGTRARIAVVATSYKNQRIERLLFISDSDLISPTDNILEYFKKLKQANRQSNLIIRGAMLLAERKLILSRNEAWKLVHGEIIPFELRTGLGRLKALKRCLELSKDIIENKKIIGVIEGSMDLNLLNAACALNKNEYLYARGLDVDLEYYLNGEEDPETGKRYWGAHFDSDTDKRDFQDFIEKYAKNISVGIFKVGMKPYLFQAHNEVFDKAAALIMADAQHQPMRGFPLLIDYADQICSKLLSSKDFEKQIMFKTAKIDYEALGFEIDPRKTRRR